MTKPKPIGTCEHIWSEWKPHFGYGCLLGSIRTHYSRSCELCLGVQRAGSIDEMLEREKVAIEEPLRGVRR